MAKICRNALLASMCALTWHASGAQTSRVDGPSGQSKRALKLVVILSRHGVRSPTWTQERLDAYSAQPWPKWGVPPADLTLRGYTLIKQFGTFDRASLASEGLFPAKGCEDAAKIYLWADTDQRTIASGKALAEGLFPGCPPQVHSLADGVNDLLFHPTASGVKPGQAEAAFAEFSARAAHPIEPSQGELLEELNNVLRGCEPKIACTPQHAPQTALLGSPAAPVRGKSDHIVDLQGPLPLGSTFSEDLLLEYADGMPMADVGWGHVDESELRRFLALHSDYFDLMHRTPELARLEASNMLMHVERTLRQGTEAKPLDGAIGPVDAKLVVLAGHDTNLAGVAALLGVHWTLDGRVDDTPPGTELAFELWHDASGAYSVRVTVAMQTLHQLRTMPELTPSAPPAQATLSLPECASVCSWDAFSQVTQKAIDQEALFPFHSN